MLAHEAGEAKVSYHLRRRPSSRGLGAAAPAESLVLVMVRGGSCPHRAAIRAQQNVGGLEVAVADVLLVQDGEPLRAVRGQLQARGGRERRQSGERGLQVAALHQRAHEAHNSAFHSLSGRQ